MKYIFFILLLGFALIERLLLDLGPNIELVTLVTLLSTFYLGRNWGIAVSLVTLAVSDIFLGNTSIAIFTWSAYGIAAIGFYKASHFVNSSKKRIGIATLAGGVFCIWFYLWTNFGVWLLDSWGMYSNDLSGLIASYINGLPFLKNQLASNLILIPLVFTVIEWLRGIIKIATPLPLTYEEKTLI